MNSLRRVALIAAVLAFGSGCLWRPPPIPPLTASDAGRSVDAATSAPDSATPPASDAGGVLSDQEACDRAARESDGAAPASVTNGGRTVFCGAPSDASVADSAQQDSAQSDTSVQDSGQSDSSVQDNGPRDASAEDGAARDDASDAGDP